jgi:hypothetical protein
MLTLAELVVLLSGACERVGPLAGELNFGRAPADPNDGRGWQVRWRVSQDGPRYRWESIDHVPCPGRHSHPSASALVGDGEREWALYPAHVVVRRYGGSLLADRLLDPSWLLGRYDLAVTGTAPLGGQAAVGITGRRQAVRRSSDRVPEVMEALVDAEGGFLHTFADLDGGVPVETIELDNVRLDAAIDDATFTVEPRPGVRVQDRSSGRRHRLTAGLRSWARPTRAYQGPRRGDRRPLVSLAAGTLLSRADRPPRLIGVAGHWVGGRISGGAGRPWT